MIEIIRATMRFILMMMIIEMIMMMIVMMMTTMMMIVVEVVVAAAAAVAVRTIMIMIINNLFHFTDRLVDLVVKASASKAEDLVFESRWRREFSGSSHTSDSKIGTPVATLPGAWRSRVGAGTGRPGVSIL